MKDKDQIDYKNKAHSIMGPEGFCCGHRLLWHDQETGHCYGDSHCDCTEFIREKPR